MPLGKTNSFLSKVIQQISSRIHFLDNDAKQAVRNFIQASRPHNTKRKLGIMEGKATVEFKSDYQITDEDMLDTI